MIILNSAHPVIGQVYLPKSVRLSVQLLLQQSSECLSCSVRGWQSLEKPVGAVEVGNSALCGVRCSSLGRECGMFHFNRNTRLCTTAEVTGLLLNTVNSPIFLTRQSFNSMSDFLHQSRVRGSREG